MPPHIRFHPEFLKEISKAFTIHAVTAGIVSSFFCFLIAFNELPSQLLIPFYGGFTFFIFMIKQMPLQQYAVSAPLVSAAEYQQ